MAITSTPRLVPEPDDDPDDVRRRHWLEATSRPPATDAEAVELADLVQALTPDSVDPGHAVFAVVWGRWHHDHPV